MSFFSNLSSIDLNTAFVASCQNASLYTLANQHRALQLDGQQVFAISIVATSRMETLCRQISLIAPPWITTVGNWISWTGFFTGIAPLVEHWIVQQGRNRGLKSVTWIGSKVMQASQRLAAGFQHSDALINVASWISYIALCTLGFPIQGAIGITGLLLVVLKRRTLLPMVVDRYLEKIFEVASLVYVLTQPSFWFFRIFNILSGIAHLHQFLSTHRITKQLIPIALRDPFHYLHRPLPINSLAYQSIKTQLSTHVFRVLPTYVHAPQVREVLPPDYSTQLANIPMAQMFNHLDAAIAQLKIEDPQWATEWAVLQSRHPEGAVDEGAITTGYDNLKTAALTGRVGDILPPDPAQLQLVIKALAHSMLEDKLNLKLKLMDFERIGKQCVERWTSEVQFLLNPKTKDLEWAVHNQLAKMRGGHLQQAILNPSNHPEIRNLITRFMSMSGSANGVHIQNAYHDAFRPIFRTYEGEIRAQVSPYGIFESLFQRYFLQDRYIPDVIKPRAGMALKETWNYAIIGMRATSSHAGCQHLGVLIPLLYSKIGNHFDTSEDLVDRIYQAIYPRLEPTADGRADVMRDIHWTSIMNWIPHFCGRAYAENPEVDPDIEPASDFYSRYVQNIQLGDSSTPYLTKEGVRLLLWDMGIFQPALIESQQ